MGALLTLGQPLAGLVILTLLSAYVRLLGCDWDILLGQVSAYRK